MSELSEEDRKKFESCAACNGTGYLQQGCALFAHTDPIEVCSKCDGSGRIPVTIVLDK